MGCQANKEANQTEEKWAFMGRNPFTVIVADPILTNWRYFLPFDCTNALAEIFDPENSLQFSFREGYLLFAVFEENTQNLLIGFIDAATQTTATIYCAATGTLYPSTLAGMLVRSSEMLLVLESELSTSSYRFTALTLDYNALTNGVEEHYTST